MRKSETGYQPRTIDLEFARELVRITKNGGHWGAPTSGLVYRIDHDQKTLTLRNPERLVNEYAAEEHAANVATFCMGPGYAVLVEDN